MKKGIPGILIVSIGSLMTDVAMGDFIASLPDPTQTYDGVYVASKHDDFWTYTATLIDEIQDNSPVVTGLEGAGDYDFATGTGGLDLLLYTGSGASNQGIGPGGAFNFEDPVYNAGGAKNSVFSGWWGQNDQDDDGTADSGKDSVNGPVKVADLLDYMHAINPDADIPVFYMDLNQNSTWDGSVYISAQISIISPDALTADPGDGSVVAQWYLDNSGWPEVPAPAGCSDPWCLDAVVQGVDNNPDDGFQPDDMVWAYGDLDWTGDSGTVYHADNNAGSGKPDFIGYVPEMDLTQFMGRADFNDLLFVTEFHFGYKDANSDTFYQLTNGFEEIFLTAQIALDGRKVPAPVPLGLLGLGLLSLAAVRRKTSRPGATN